MKTIGNMKNFCFGRSTIFILLINLINYGRSATVPNKDDLFRANVTMKNFETTQVNISQKKKSFVFFF
jgi:hypothetical protein